MGKFKDMANKFASINLDTELYLAVMDEQQHAIDLNIKQLDKGEYSDGANLPEYSDVSVEVFGKEPGPFTLEETGDFKRAFEMKGNFDEFNITSYDNKTDKIINMTHPDIFGLQPNNLKIFSNYIKENLLTRIKQYINV